MSDQIQLIVSLANVVSFARHQANVPVVGELRLPNDSNENIDGLTAELTCEPPVIATRRWTFDRIGKQSEVTPADRTVTLDGGMLDRLTERMRATVTSRVMQGETSQTLKGRSLLETRGGSMQLCEWLGLRHRRAIRPRLRCQAPECRATERSAVDDEVVECVVPVVDESVRRAGRRVSHRPRFYGGGVRTDEGSAAAVRDQHHSVSTSGRSQYARRSPAPGRSTSPCRAPGGTVGVTWG